MYPVKPVDTKEKGTTAIFSQTKQRLKQNSFKTIFLLNKSSTSAQNIRIKIECLELFLFIISYF